MGAEGWVTDPNALFTLLSLRGLRVGDELLYEKLRPHILRDSPTQEDIDSEGHANGIYAMYCNAKLSRKSYPLGPGETGDPEHDWRLIGWRRPRG